MSDVHLSPLPPSAFDAFSMPVGFGFTSPEEEAAALNGPCLYSDDLQQGQRTPADAAPSAFEFMPATPEQRRIMDEMEALDAERNAPRPGDIKTPSTQDSAPRTEDGRPLLCGLPHTPEYEV